MKTLKTSFVLLLAIFLIAAVNSQIPFVSSQPYCPAEETLNLGIKKSQAPNYDVYGYYYEGTLTDNSADIFVTFGNSANNVDFSFTVNNDETGAPSSLNCQQTANMQFVALLEGALILKHVTTDTKYYACVFDAKSLGGTLARAQLLLPTSDFPTPKDIKPFYYNDVQRKVLLAISDATEGNIFEYIIPSTTQITTGTTQITSTKLASKNDVAMAQIVGSAKLFYVIAPTPKLLGYANNEWVDNTNTYSVKDKIVHFMPLANNYWGLAVLPTSGLEAALAWGLNQAVISQDDTPIQTTRIYQVQSQRISSFVVYSQDYFFWFNLDPAGNPINANVRTNGIDTGTNMVAMALSSNKLAVLYVDVVKYYVITTENSAGTIKQIFSKQFAPADIDGDGSFRFGLTCVCKKLKRFSCYSSTLNCLLIKKGTGVCGGKQTYKN